MELNAEMMKNTMTPEIMEDLVETVAKIEKKEKELVELKKAVDAYTLPVFEKYEFFCDGKKITDPDHLYMADDFYDDEVEKYFEEVENEKIKAGFEKFEKFCPYLVAKSEIVTLKKELIKIFEPVTNITMDMILMKIGHFDTYIDLIRKMVKSYNKKKKKT